LSLNRMIQESANPPQKGKSQLQVGERIFRVGDRVIHRRNNYDLGVFNGDIGVIKEIDNEELTCVVWFFPDGRTVDYKRDDIPELDLAYAITIHNRRVVSSVLLSSRFSPSISRCYSGTSFTPP
jgi:exodeoxyribonuclease V alpha subunit